MFSCARWGANSLPSNRLAGFEGPLRGGERGKRKMAGMEGERKGRTGWEKTPHEINFCLWPWAVGNVALLWRSETIAEAVSCISNTEFRQHVAGDAGKLSQHVTFQRMQPANDDQRVERWSKVNLCHLRQGRCLQTLTVGTNSRNSNAHAVCTQNCTQTTAPCKSIWFVVLRTHNTFANKSFTAARSWTYDSSSSNWKHLCQGVN